MIALLLFNVPVTVSPLDYWTGLIGSFVAGCFCWFLAYLIRDAKRYEVTDRGLSLTMAIFGTIAFYGTYRFITLKAVPYVYPALWVALVCSCAFATVCLLRERRLRKKALQNEANR